MRLALAIAALLVSADARAAEPAEAERSIAAAREHFDRGKALFGARDFAAALAELETARALRPSAAFDYNIALCLEELGRNDEALAAYLAFAAHTLDAAAAAEAKERIAALRARGAHEPAAAVTVSERTTRRVSVAAPAATAAIALAMLGIGGGLRGSVDPAYDELRARWDPGPRTPELQREADALHRRENAGLALIGVGAAVAVIDVGLWIWWARSRR